MNLYKGLVKFDKDNKIEDVVVVDEGFSWGALILNPIWFLFHKMWLEFFLFLSILILFNWTSRFGIYDFFMQASLIFMMALKPRNKDILQIKNIFILDVKNVIMLELGHIIKITGLRLQNSS
jgi:hypothetical protein